MRGRGKKIRLGGQKRSTLDWVGETPRCQKFTCKSSQLPPLFSSVFMVFPPPVLSSPPASCLLTSFPLSLVCLPHNLPASLSLSVLPCLLSSCIAPPAPWCSTDNQNSARIHIHDGHAGTHTYRLIHTHTHRETHTHHFRQPPPSLTSFHCRHETLYNPWCASASSRDIASITSQLYSAFTHHSIPHMNHCNEK